MKIILSAVVAIILLAAPGIADDQSASIDRKASDTQEIVGLWLMGQSLCEGAESLPVVTPADSGWGNLRFQRGVRTWIHGRHGDQPAKRLDDQFALVPLSAMKMGGLGETIANGLADHLTFRHLGSPSGPPKKLAGARRFLTAYAGQGGRFIDELSHLDQTTDPRTPASRQHGGGYYRTSLDDARRAKAQAAAQGLDFSIAALFWMQGEANAGPTGGIRPNRWDEEMPRPAGLEWYRDRLIDYRARWSRDLRKITGQSSEIPLFTYQTLSPAGEAQLMAADLDPHITMVGPHYMVPSAVNSRYLGRYGDPIHLSADGERWYGEQVAKVVDRVLTEKEAWEPLRPSRAVIAADRRRVEVEFHVPRPPLVLDETFLPRQEYSQGQGFHSRNGFQIRSSSGAVVPVKDVIVAAPTRVHIELSAALNSDTQYTLSYGLPYAGHIGTIADIRPGAAVQDHATTELVVRGAAADRLETLLREGAFFATNMLSGEAHARAPIRRIDHHGETAVLRFETRELRNSVEFAIGQSLTALRGFSYGNLRDSDDEPAVYEFADDGYGKRFGQPYPLWNWCVLFRELPITEP